MDSREITDRRLTVGLLGASFGTNNLGVAALTCGTVASVYHSYPDARLFLLDYGKEPAVYRVAHPGGVAEVDFVNIRFSKRFYLKNNIAFLLFLAFCLKIVPSRKMRERLFQRNHILGTIWNADILCSLAGGDSFSDIYGLGRLIYVTLPQFLVLLVGKPLVLLPQTLGPFNGMFAKAIARIIVKRSKKVYTRDLGGLKQLGGLADSNHGQLAFSHDMGFALEPEIRTERIPPWLAEHNNNGIPFVGLNVSGLLYIGGYTRCNMFGIKADYRKLIHDLIDLLVRKHGAHVMLVPHVFGTGGDSESDLVACRKVYDGTVENMRGHLHLLEQRYDQHEIKALIGKCDFFIGSRMHACIAAISQCIPSIGLAYSRKFHGVFESVGMGELVVDIRECDENAVLDAVDRSYRRILEYRANLEATIPAVKESVLGFFRQLMLAPIE